MMEDFAEKHLFQVANIFLQVIYDIFLGKSIARGLDMKISVMTNEWISSSKKGLAMKNVSLLNRVIVISNCSVVRA